MTALAATFLHQQPLSCTSRHQRLPVLNQQPPSCTGDHLPAPATTSPEPATAFLHQWSPSGTSRYQQLPVLHQQLPVLHQQLPILNQRPFSCTSRSQSCTSDNLSNEYQSCTSYPDLLQWLDPAPMITIRPRWLFAIRFSNLRFTIIKFGLSKQHPCFVILA